MHGSLAPSGDSDVQAVDDFLALHAGDDVAQRFDQRPQRRPRGR